jgi:hypothetical protein
VLFVAPDEHTIGNVDVEMKRQLQGRVEALHKRDAAVGIRARRADAKFSRAPALEREDHEEDHAQRFSGELWIGCEMPAHSTRKCRHPLAHRHAREHAVDQMRGGVVHAACRARWADSAAFAREADQMFGAAANADDTRKTMREDAAAEVRLQLPVYVAGQAMAERACFRERTPQSFQLGRNNLVDQRVFGRASSVLDRRASRSVHASCRCGAGRRSGSY